LSESSDGDRDEEDEDEYDDMDEESLTDSLEEGGGGAGWAARRSARAARKAARREAFANLSSDEKVERRKERARMYSHIARKRQESNMKELKAEMECLTVYRLIIEESPDMIAVLGPDMEGRVLFANAAFARGMEAMPGGYMGKPIWSVVHEAHRGELMQAVRNIILNTETTSRLTCQGKYPHPDYPGQDAIDLAMKHSPTGIICYMRRAQFEVAGGGGGGGGGMEHPGIGGLSPET
jgi:PAS domain-containing protein